MSGDGDEAGAWTVSGANWPFALSYFAHCALVIVPPEPFEQRRLTSAAVVALPFVSTMTFLPLFVVSKAFAVTTLRGKAICWSLARTSVTIDRVRQPALPSARTHTEPSPFASHAGRAS